MKKTIVFIALALIGLSTANAQVGIGTTSPNPSSILDMTATDKGFLPPRLSTPQRDAIASPAEGLTIYNTDNKCLETYNGASWISLCSGDPLALTNVCDPANPTAVIEVQAAGYTWMDRNLGASRAALSSTDFEAYGDLYQWGRGNDGHQCINWVSATASDGAEQSNESTSQSTSPNPGSTFITGFSNWYNGTNPDDLWKPDLTGVNNPCPSGYRLPTDAEWNAELSSWSSNNAAGAYASPLKLPVAGARNRTNGSLASVGSIGYYWSSTVSGTLAGRLFFNSSDAAMNASSRALGFSVRCLKD